MQDNPFLTVLKIAATSVLAFLVFVSFWQRNHLEDQVADMARENSGLRDRVGEMSRKIDDLKSKADRVEGAADELSKLLRSGGVSAPSVSPREVDSASQKTKAWGWELNAGLDAALDPKRAAGTPGRFRNALEIDPDPEYPAEASKFEGGTLATPYGDDPKGWNLLTENAAELQEIMELYCTDSPAGTHFADPYRYSPAMCWRVEIDPEFQEYTLFFRRDLTWHPLLVNLDKFPHLKGRHEVTARDFKFTIDMITNPQTDCAPLRAYFDEENFSGVELIDEYTCVVRWKRKVWHSRDFTLGRAVMPEFLFSKDEKGRAFPKETIGSQFNDHFYNQVGVCGCGPYRMSSYQQGQWITLERFDDYYGAREGRVYPIRTKKLLIYSDPETTLLKLQSGEIDMTGLTAGQWKAKILNETDPKSPFKDGRIVPYKTKRPAYRYIGWKNTSPLFTDKNVRKALALAANRIEVAEKIFLGKWVPMAIPVWPDSPQYDPALTVLPYDPAEAKRLLDAAGWKLNPETGIREKDGRRFAFKLTYGSGSPDFTTFVSQYKNELRSIGVEIELESIEWNLMQKRLESREFEAVLSGWATSSWDHDFEQIWTTKQILKPKSSNAIEYSNPEVDRLSDELRAEMDVSKRKEKVMKIARHLYDDQPVMFIAWDTVYGGHRDVVKNVNAHLHKSRPFQRTYSLWVAR